MRQWGNPSGLLVAVLGFGVTRIFAAESVRIGDPLPFVLGAIVPLVVGLGVTVYGVTLAVGSFPGRYVTTVAKWCLGGAVGMAGILAVTWSGPLLRGAGADAAVRSRLLVANVMLGGTVGGVLIGVRSARNHRQRREIRRQANRVLLLDRLLRHEVINAATIIDGHAELLDGAEAVRGESVSQIRSASRRIVETIDDIGDLTDDVNHTRTDVGDVLETEIDAIKHRFPGVSLHVELSDEVTTILADNADLVYRELLENAAEYADSTVAVTAEATGDAVSVTISDDGPGLPAAQRELLRSGRFPEYDDPTAGFGLQIVRLLVVQHDGRITVGEGIGGSGQSITVSFPREGRNPDDTQPLSLSAPDIYRAVTAGLLAGVVMGGFVSLTSDLLPVIGSLYGIENPVIGWVTHLFHSVVFALLFAAGCSVPLLRPLLDGPVRGAAAGILWGAMLWLVAAGVVMSLWLQAVGIPAPFPNLPRIGLVSHVLWGAVLGASYVLLGTIDWTGKIRPTGVRPS